MFDKFELNQDGSAQIHFHCDAAEECVEEKRGKEKKRDCRVDERCHIATQTIIVTADDIEMHKSLSQKPTTAAIIIAAKSLASEHCWGTGIGGCEHDRKKQHVCPKCKTRDVEKQILEVTSEIIGSLPLEIIHQYGVFPIEIGKDAKGNIVTVVVACRKGNRKYVPGIGNKYIVPVTAPNSLVDEEIKKHFPEK